MSRTDAASRVVGATPARTYQALVDPDALQVWLPPSGMSARFEHFDLRVGGGYRLILTYADAAAAPGKCTADSDIGEAHFVALEPGVRVVQAIDFESTDPAFSGTMLLTWSVTATPIGCRVDVRADDVPRGISAADHAAGLRSSLENLAAYLEADDSTPISG